MFLNFLYLGLCLLLWGCQAERFLIPILWHGPNNQITEIKETVSLSYLLPESVAVIPNLKEHKFSDGADAQMLSAELFDLDVIKGASPSVVLLDDIRKDWNGTLDAVVYFRDDEFPAVRSLVSGLGLTAPGPDRWLRSPVSHARGCRQFHVEALRQMVLPYRYVGILSYDDFVLQAHKLAGTLLSSCGEDLCCQAYKEHSVLIRMSPQVKQLADDFIRQNLGADGGRFVAIHIRPMPDDCIKVWQLPAEHLDEKMVSDICRTEYMHIRFIPNLQFLMRAYNVTQVFVMMHPYIRPRVFRMLESAGIRPASLDLDHLNASISAATSPLRTPLSFSLLAMVEEAVAAAATAFLGTAESSMTGMIVQERLARGIPADTNHFMSRRVNCLEAPCRLEDYYVLRAGMPQIPPGAQPRRVGPLKDFASWQREAPK